MCLLFVLTLFVVYNYMMPWHETEVHRKRNHGLVYKIPTMYFFIKFHVLILDLNFKCAVTSLHTTKFYKIRYYKYVLKYQCKGIPPSQSKYDPQSQDKYNQSKYDWVEKIGNRMYVLRCLTGYPDNSPTDISPTDSSPPDISPTDNSPTDIPSKSPLRRTFRQPYIFSSKIRSYFLINPMITTVQNYYKIIKKILHSSSHVGST